MSQTPSRRRFLRTLGAGAAAPIAAKLLAVEEAFSAELRSVSRTPLNGLQDPVFASQYLLDPTVTYLNHASIGTVPQAVHSAGIRYREICEENPWLYIWGGAWEEAREEVRARSAEAMGCDSDQIAITHNTTEGFNLLAQGLPLGAGDEILFSSLNHPGASICWEFFAPSRGYSVRRFEFPVADVPEMSPSDVVTIHEEEISDRTRVLVLPHIDNIVGLRHPLRALAAMAHDRGVEYVFVDGAQSAGMIPLSIAESGIDAFATSPHKWIQSPKGLGLFWVRGELLSRLRPIWVTWGQDRWEGSARIYEDYGTRDLPEVLSLGDALDFQAALGEERKERAYRSLFQSFMSRVDATPGVRWRSPRRWEAGGILTAIEVVDRPVARVSDRLYRDHGIVVRPFPTPALNTLRVSPNLMNSVEELDFLLEVLRDGA